jgi:hypothetical protein
MVTLNYRSIPIIDRFTKKILFTDAEFRGFAPLGRFDIHKKNHYFSRCGGIEIPKQRVWKKCLANAGSLTQGKEVKDEE